MSKLISEKLGKNQSEELEKILKKRKINHKFEINHSESKNEGENIIMEIERITNEYYSDNIIKPMEIIQVSNNQYLFDKIKLFLLFKNNQLFTKDCENFEKWLIKNF